MDNTLEGQGQSNSAENECDYDEIDIVSHPAEHEIAEIKRETSSDGQWQTMCFHVFIGPSYSAI